ncbi:MAG: hypothetical protein AMJ84_06585 [Acidithiobacillales bacterium SM23_46]|nr:MAG: hypothetical protein AMJ84_06585 [Acidithiobacillales bacterium SM23_46]KPL27382.1 MAG: hypothetical protein AMJ72_09200 [Acidithiobacillales bacterium SM1_46]
MSFDRRSFRFGIVAGAFLVIGVVAGIVFSSRMDWVAPAQSEQTVAPALPAGSAPPSFVPVVKASMPAVVNISTSRTIKRGEEANPFMDDPFFRHFFGEEFGRRFQIPKERRENSLGSGVIVSADGYIVTNNHVVAKADEIKVLLSDKREFTGKVIGTDPRSDIAVIKINAKNLPVLPWADSDKLDVGEYVLAIGNPFGLTQTVTMGIVSATGRANVGIADYEDFIQTDAAINPGNSGGALVNVRGELVGINTAIFSKTGGSMGVGFAVPANMARGVMESLIKSGRVVRGWLGVSIQEVTPALAKQFGLTNGKGALVNKVVPSSPAAAAGLQKGDVIMSFNGKGVDSPGVLRNTVAQTAVGQTVKVEVMRDRKSVKLDVKIAEQPKDMAKAGVEEEGVQEGAEGSALAGIEVRTLTSDIARQLGLPSGTAGVLVSDVVSGSLAETAGVEQGDVIVEINHQPVRNTNDYRRISTKLGKKANVLLLINRRGDQLYLAIEPR